MGVRAVSGFILLANSDKNIIFLTDLDCVFLNDKNTLTKNHWNLRSFDYLEEVWLKRRISNSEFRSDCHEKSV